MRSLATALTLSIGWIGPVVAASAASSATAADAGEAIVTVQTACWPSTDPGADNDRVRRCAAIYRNASDRPAFDIRIEATVDGRPATVESWLGGDAKGVMGTRSALGPGERGLAIVSVHDAGLADERAVVAIQYRAARTGNADELDVPAPELQYVDRVDHGAHTEFIGEVRNAGARSWASMIDDGDEWRTPVLALFRRGALIAAASDAWRKPDTRIGPDGRYVFVAEIGSSARDADAVQVFFRDRFTRDTRRFTDAHWQLIGLDLHVASGPSGASYIAFRAAVRNPTAMRSYGHVGAIARRADFHAIGIGSCHGFLDVPAGAEASCTGEVWTIRHGATMDDVRFVTIELGGAVAALPPATATATATPCPAHATPAPVPTLSLAAGRVWLPWTHRPAPARCP